MAAPLRLFQPDTETDNTAEVGVVIPVYNRRTTLLETLPFVLAQTLPPVRLVVVDDGSTDGSADAAEAWLRDREPRFEWRVLREPHRTAAAAREDGFKLVEDLPLVAFLDSDDHWPADFLARCTAILAAAPHAVAASADRSYRDTLDRRQPCDCGELAADPLAWFFAHGAGVASCTLFRTTAVRSAGGWRPELKIGEDTWLFSQVSLLGKWLHARGDAVTFNLGNAEERNEAGNLSRLYQDADLRWVRIYERLYDEVCKRRPWIDRDTLAHALSVRWMRAGKQLLRLGDTQRARDCFKRSVGWNPAQLKAWRRLATTSLGLPRAA